jgi:formate/nitrite transporter FocA (FNT family)
MSKASAPAMAWVCLALWMSYAGRSVIDKAVAIIFPIAAFRGRRLRALHRQPVLLCDGAAAGTAGLGALLGGMLRNIVAVVIGNVIGGSVLVGLVYYLIYIRRPRGA